MTLLAIAVMTLGVSCKNKTAAYTPKPEDYIVRVTGSFPLNPDPGVGSSAIEAAAQFNIYDSLVFPKDDGTIDPHIATDWTMSPDGMKWTFHLRKGVKFHDGNELKADDVAFSMNRMLTLGEGFAYLYTSYVKNAVATDDYTVVFNMKRPFGPFVASLVRCGILEKSLVEKNEVKPGAYGDNGDYGTQWLLTHDAGSGPYFIKEVQVDQYLLGQKFDDYYGGWQANAPNYFKILSSVDPNTVRILMEKRQLEIVDEWQSMDNIKALSKVKGIDVPLMSAGALVDIDMNTKKAPTDDVHFRKALAYLMNYDVVTKDIYPGSKQAVGPVSISYKGHDPNLFQYKYDPNQALAELKQSKYYNQLDNYHVTLAWSSDVPDEEKLSLQLQADAAQVGIKIDIQKTPFTSLIKDAQSIDSTPNAVIMYPGDSYNEAGSVLALRYSSSTAGTFTQFEWLQNKQIDTEIEDALSTLDQQARFQKYATIQQQIVDLCPTIWVCEYPERRAYQAAYIDWPEAQAAENGTLQCPVMGRFLYFHDMKVYPEKRQALL
jgi:peptide/nickel transport system substrate-binding protein